MSLITNIQGYWKMDELSGDAADASGNANTLTNVNTIAYAAGKINNQSNFVQASSQKFSIADASQTGLDITGDMSISLWATPSSSANSRTMISKSGAAGSRGYVWRLDDNVTLSFTTSDDGTNQTTALWTISAISVATHLVVIYTAAAGTADLYLNNAAQTQQTGLGTSQVNNSQAFCIGGRANNINYFDGGIDEIGIWSRVLTSGEVSTLYNAGAGIQYPFTGSTTVANRKLLLGVGK